MYYFFSIIQLDYCCYLFVSLLLKFSLNETERFTWTTINEILFWLIIYGSLKAKEYLFYYTRGNYYIVITDREILVYSFVIQGNWSADSSMMARLYLRLHIPDTMWKYFVACNARFSLYIYNSLDLLRDNNVSLSILK